MSFLWSMPRWFWRCKPNTHSPCVNCNVLFMRVFADQVGLALDLDHHQLSVHHMPCHQNRITCNLCTEQASKAGAHWQWASISFCTWGVSCMHWQCNRHNCFFWFLEWWTRLGKPSHFALLFIFPSYLSSQIPPVRRLSRFVQRPQYWPQNLK